MAQAKKIWFFTESWGANKGLGEAPKSCTRKEHESATNSIAKRGQGAIAPCRVKGQRPLWGLGQRPNCSASDQFQGSRQQRCRQRSVPAPNFARPQTRPQVALPQRFREEPIKTPYRVRKCPVWGFNCHDIISASPQILPATAHQSSGTCTSDAQHRGTLGHCPAAADPASLGRARSTSACAD